MVDGLDQVSVGIIIFDFGENIFLFDIAWKPSCIYLSGADGAQTNDRWIMSGNPVFISLSEPNKAVCYA